MRQLFSGIVLAVALVAAPALAQTKTLPSATVKLNGASGGGSGAGFECDLLAEECVYTAGCEDCNVFIDAAQTAFRSYDGLTTFLTLAATSVAPVSPFLMNATIPATFGVNSVTASATAQGTFNECVSTSGDVTVTLPTTPAANGQELWVYNRAGVANNCTIAAPAGQSLDGVVDGTVVMADGEVRRLLRVNSAGDWRTEALYPVAHNVTVGNVPYASTATAFADSPIIRESANITSLRNGTNAQEFKLFATYSGAGANYEDFFIRTNSTTTWRIGTEKLGTGAARDIRFFPDGTDVLRISSTLIEPVVAIVPATSNTISLGQSSSLFRLLYHTYGQMGASTKALVDATATNIWQVSVNSNSYEGGVLHYTIYATDGTDRQQRSGIVAFSALNNGGTETCVFGTPNDVVNVTSGTLTVTWDCAAGSDVVLIRATADTSLASTTTFTSESRLNISSGNTVLTPQ